MLLSVIVPCYNEEAVLRAAHERLSQTLAKLPDVEFELIFVDDGSTDDTFRLLTELQTSDSRARVLRLSRNFGHQVAVTAGLSEATGDAVVIIDADLQDPPEVIPEMFDLWRAGNDVVYGSRVTREGEGRFKLWTAKIFYRLINRLSDIEIPVDTGDFRLIDRQVVNVLLAMPERGRFLRGMVSWVGFRQTPVFYKRAARHAGSSKYPLFKMIKFGMDGIVSFSVLPLRLAALTGLAAIWIALAGIVLAVIVRVFGLYDLQLGRGWASLFVAILFMGGVQLLCLGLIGEYLGRIYTEVKQRPLYAVSQRLGFAGSENETATSRPGRARAAL
jgi:polyisoprenyl-phosphate glycosyltransferase